MIIQALWGKKGPPNRHPIRYPFFGGTLPLPCCSASACLGLTCACLAQKLLQCLHAGVHFFGTTVSKLWGPMVPKYDPILGTKIGPQNGNQNWPLLFNLQLQKPFGPHFGNHFGSHFGGQFWSPKWEPL